VTKTVQRMVRFPEVIKKFGYARPTIYVKMANGTFPQAMKLSPGGRAIGWPEDVLLDYQESLAAKDRR
jgi:predicted DNA-binding transcriptional regulator AlpA